MNNLKIFSFSKLLNSKPENNYQNSVKTKMMSVIDSTTSTKLTGEIGLKEVNQCRYLRSTHTGTSGNFAWVTNQANRPRVLEESRVAFFEAE